LVNVHAPGSRIVNPSPAVIVVSDEEAGDTVVDVVLEVDGVLEEVGEEVVVAEGRTVVGELGPAWWGLPPHAESAARTKMAGIT
jgi:hypothetical protein